jgi:hypothetical protein
VAGRLKQLAARLQLDKLVITTNATSEAARIKSYQLIAREFELTPEH